jgi:putative transposase
MKKAILVKGEIYHIYSKSIADYIVFNSDKDFLRMIATLKFYVDSNAIRYCSLDKDDKKGKYLVQVLAYCLMGTHLHLLLKQLEEDGISIFMSRVLNSYTRHFNSKYKRKGPLWEGRFRRLLVENDEYFLHLTRYIHLNPVTACLVNNPEEWKFSSYNQYIGKDPEDFCDFKEYLEMSAAEYEDFVKSRINYQKELAIIKHLFLD